MNMENLRSAAGRAGITVYDNIGIMWIHWPPEDEIKSKIFFDIFNKYFPKWVWSSASIYDGRILLFGQDEDMNNFGTTHEQRDLIMDFLNKNLPFLEMLIDTVKPDQYKRLDLIEYQQLFLQRELSQEPDV